MSIRKELKKREKNRKQRTKPEWILSRRSPLSPQRRGQGQWDDQGENLGIRTKAKYNKLGSYRDFRFLEKRNALQLSWFYIPVIQASSLQFFQC